VLHAEYHLLFRPAWASRVDSFPQVDCVHPRRVCVAVRLPSRRRWRQACVPCGGRLFRFEMADWIARPDMYVEVYYLVCVYMYKDICIYVSMYIINQYGSSIEEVHEWRSGSEAYLPEVPPPHLTHGLYKQVPGRHSQ